MVYAGTHEGRLFHPGQAVDLRQDKAVRVRLLGVWAPGQEEPWWLATDLPDPLADLVACMTGAWVSGYPGRPLRRSPAPPSTWPASPSWSGSPSSCGPPSGRPSVHLPCKPKGPRLSLLRVGIRPAESD
jgi:hypothetical protein